MDPQRSHPLRMMAQESDPRISHNVERPNHAPHRFHPGKGKGKGNRADAGIDAYFLPEMFEDPWLDLYSTLPEPIRSSVCVHLSTRDCAQVHHSNDNRPVPPAFKKSNIG